MAPNTFTAKILVFVKNIKLSSPRSVGPSSFLPWMLFAVKPCSFCFVFLFLWLFPFLDIFQGKYLALISFISTASSLGLQNKKEVVWIKEWMSEQQKPVPNFTNISSDI